MEEIEVSANLMTKPSEVIPIAVPSQRLDSIIDKPRSAKQARKMGMSELMYRKFYQDNDNDFN